MELPTTPSQLVVNEKNNFGDFEKYNDIHVGVTKGPMEIG